MDASEKEDTEEDLTGREGLRQKKLHRFEAEYTERPPFPKELFIDITNACNHSCFFCTNPNTKTPKTLIDADLTFRLIDEASELGVSDIAFYSTGEPFLHKNLSDFIARAKARGIDYVFLSTNGALAGRARAKAAIDAGLDSVKFSVNGGSRQTYKQVHRADDFGKVIENIRWVSEYRASSGRDFGIYVSCVENSRNHGDWDILKKELADYVDEFDHRDCSNQGGNMLVNNKTETIDAANLLGSLLPEQLEFRHCPDPFHRLTVTPQGYATACVVDYDNYLAAENLKDCSLRAAWDSVLFQRLRKRHLTGQLEGLICNNCLHNKKTECVPLNRGLCTPKS